MSFQFSTIASGSSGNCIYIGTQKTKILVDVGVSGKKVEQGLSNIGIDIKDIDAVFITHEHSDHIKGIGVLSRKYDIPIFANERTWNALDDLEKVVGKIQENHKQKFVTDKDFVFKDLVLHPYSIPHDAAEPVGYAFYYENKKISMATDLGHVNEHIKKNIMNSNLILLEANHDVEMLKFGSYPYYLKRRVMGDYGHLCNEAAAALLVDVYHENLQTVILGHLSKENNFPDLAYKTIEGCLKEEGIFINDRFQVNVAQREQASPLYAV